MSDQAENTLTPEEKDALRVSAEAYVGSAVYSNRFYVTAGPAGVRIGFMEQQSLESPPHFRSAVVLDTLTAVELVNVITRLLGSDTTPEAEESANG